jgi:fumarate hydratase subunit beta
MAEYRLKTPISELDIRKLRVGDVLYISGSVFTARDAAHERMLEYHKMEKKLPIKTYGLVLFHCGPIVRETDGKYEVVAAGPTTSSRMEMFEDALIENFGIRIVIGKGGMGSRTLDAMKKFGAVYCSFTGGAGALAAKAVKKVKKVEWLDLGAPEAIWTLEVQDFGPLIVTVDSHGNDLYGKVMEQVEKNRRKIYQKIS